MGVRRLLATVSVHADAEAAVAAARAALAAGTGDQAAIDAATRSASGILAALLGQAERVRQYWLADPALQGWPHGWPKRLQPPIPSNEGQVRGGIFWDAHDWAAAFINVYAPSAPYEAKLVALVRAACWVWASPRSPVRSVSVESPPTSEDGANVNTPGYHEGQGGGRSDTAPYFAGGSIAWREFDSDFLAGSGAKSVLGPYRNRRAVRC